MSDIKIEVSIKNIDYKSVIEFVKLKVHLSFIKSLLLKMIVKNSFRSSLLNFINNNWVNKKIRTKICEYMKNNIAATITALKIKETCK